MTLIIERPSNITMADFLRMRVHMCLSSKGFPVTDFLEVEYGQQHVDFCPVPSCVMDGGLIVFKDGKVVPYTLEPPIYGGNGVTGRLTLDWSSVL